MLLSRLLAPNQKFFRRDPRRLFGQPLPFMLLKRSIVLAAGVLLFIAAIIIYFHVSHAQMEARFQAEREKFGVQGVVLTASAQQQAPVLATPAAIPAPTPG